jgi:amino acid adenylation domain-containing protein
MNSELKTTDASGHDRARPLPACDYPQVVHAWNRTDAVVPADACLHELFEAQARETPHAVALVQDDRRLTYAELNAQANRLAHHLRALGAQPDDRIAICAERGMTMVIGLLAVLKSGAAYVPLDPAYPGERLAHMLEDSGCIAVLTHGSLQRSWDARLRGAAGDRPVIDMEAWTPAWQILSETDPQRASTGLQPHHLAYVIYTSGSTGRAKGVMVEHRGVVNLVAAQGRGLQVERDSRVLQFASFSFDACIFEVVMALCRGAALVLPRRGDVLVGEVLAATIERHAVTHATLTPTVLSSLPDSATLASVTTLVVAGEEMPPSLVQRWAAGRHLVNAYGPTEATVWASQHDCRVSDAGRPPIGRPIANVRLYILDEESHPVAVGEIGELHVGGAGVARGYLNLPQLTGERFVDDPFLLEGHGRMYRTGDLARWRPDGEIDYVGRSDFQVKLRGYRIELGEIEACLARHPRVHDAVVLARQDRPGDKRLVAYYACRNLGDETPSGSEPGDLRRYLAGMLPEHMVPRAYVRLDGFPLTPNGKLDRGALPAPEAAHWVGADRDYEAPRGEVELAIATIWTDLLQIDRVGRFDQFFEMGGDSLLAVQLVERMRRAGLAVDASTLFAAPSLAALAEGTQRAVPAAAVPGDLIPRGCTTILPEMLPLVRLTPADIERVVSTVPGGAANVQDIYPLSPLQEGILFHHLMSSDGDPYLLSRTMRFADEARLKAWLAALQLVIDRNDILRTAVIWDGLPMPVQVVWRSAILPVEELVLDTMGADGVAQLNARLDVRHTRLDLQVAPLMRAIIAHDVREGRWLLTTTFHHMMCDDATLALLQEEIEACLLGRADRLPPPRSYRTFVAQARPDAAATSSHEDFFRAMLGDMEEATAPFGLREIQGDGNDVDEATLDVDATLAGRLRRQARMLGVSPASLCHLACALVVARTSGRNDVVFGTTLIGRMHGGRGADRVMGLFMNTLPIRIRVDGTDVVSRVRQVHAQLAGLLKHEQAPLSLAQGCSGVQAPTPLFTALFNYRHAQAAHGYRDPDDRAAREGSELVCGEERTNYPLTLSIDDSPEGMRLKSQTRRPVAAAALCRFMHQALEQLTLALEESPGIGADALDVLPPDERGRLLQACNPPRTPYPADLCVHELFELQAARTPGPLQWSTAGAS